MTRVLFCVIPERGHLNPYIGPAQALQEAGVEVVFHAAADISLQLRAAGLESFVGMRDQRSPDAHRGPAFAAAVRDPAWLRGWIKSLLVDTAARDVEPMSEVFRRSRPDVVALDPMVYAAAIAAELEGIPWAAISNSLNPVLPEELDSELLRTVRWLAPERQALFARYDLSAEFRGCDVLSPHLTIAFTTESLVGVVPGVELVGPSLPRAQRGDEVPFDWDLLDPDLPLIYMSLGSQISHQPALFELVGEAVRGRRAQLVLSAPELADALGGLPPNVVACPYVPQLELLRRACAFITHGGANSVMEAIAFGVPVLLAPLCNDQFHQAYFVQRSGIGGCFDPLKTSPRELWRAIEALLGDGPPRRRMADVCASYRRDGAGEAARLLIELAARSHRAPAS
jgi:zeaxanthin glucosyltransferase